MELGTVQLIPKPDIGHDFEHASYCFLNSFYVPAHTVMLPIR